MGTGSAVRIPDLRCPRTSFANPCVVLVSVDLGLASSPPPTADPSFHWVLPSPFCPGMRPKGRVPLAWEDSPATPQPFLKQGSGMPVLPCAQLCKSDANTCPFWHSPLPAPVGLGEGPGGWPGPPGPPEAALQNNGYLPLGF